MILLHLTVLIVAYLHPATVTHVATLHQAQPTIVTQLQVPVLNGIRLR